jgi:hypothetical protein
VALPNLPLAVISSRFSALEKNGKTPFLGRSSHSWDRKPKIRIGDLALRLTLPTTRDMRTRVASAVATLSSFESGHGPVGETPSFSRVFYGQQAVRERPKKDLLLKVHRVKAESPGPQNAGNTLQRHPAMTVCVEHIKKVALLSARQTFREIP